MAKGHLALTQRQFETLFGAMATGGLLGFKQVDWFNGGLFTANEALHVELADIKQLLALAALDWYAIDLTIAGTLFVQSLGPGLRAQLGAEYIVPATILRLVNPLVLDPLRAEMPEKKFRFRVGRSGPGPRRAWSPWPPWPGGSGGNGHR